MGLLNEEDRNQLKEMFDKGLENNVEILHFADNGDNCEYSEQTKELLREVVDLHDKLSLTLKTCKDSELMESEGIEMCPSLKVKSSRNGFINFYGTPAGYEFSSLVEDILDMGSDTISLEQETIEELKKIDKPVDIKVFITSSCPYCPRAVRTAHQFSMVNNNIKASMVDAHRFPELARENNVSSVPQVVINDSLSFVGALPEKEYLEKVKEALS